MTTPNTTSYDGMLSGLTSSNGDWSYEGASYEVQATETQVIECVDEALAEPDESTVAAARKLVFGVGATYTSQALIAIAAAYAAECEGGDGVGAVLAVLQDAARRIAVIEALTS